MSEGLQRAYAATHGLELGATYKATGYFRGQTRTLSAITQTPKGTAVALYLHANGSEGRCRLSTFAKWAKAAERVT